MQYPKRVAIYARTSTVDKQSPEMQLRDLTAYAAQRGYTVFESYTDQSSGSVQRRPALDLMMDAARKRKFDVVLVWRFDRFARSTAHLTRALAEFKSLGIDFISFNENIDTGSPIGEAIFTIIGAMSQLERDIIRERVRGGLRNAKAKGKRLGRPKAAVDTAEVLRLRQRGLSIREIATSLGISHGVIQRTVQTTKLSAQQ